MNKNMLISVFTSLLIMAGALYFASGRSPSSGSGGNDVPQNVEVADGVQRVTILAKGGYFPRVTDIKGSLPTILLVKTNNTRDCSLSLVVRPVGFQKVLQSTGEEVIDLGTPQSGEEIRGICGMGMYSFLIRVN